MPPPTEPPISGKIASSEDTRKVILVPPPAPLDGPGPVILAPLSLEEERVGIDPVDPVSQAIQIFQHPKPGLTFEDQQAAGLILANEIIRRDLLLQPALVGTPGADQAPTTPTSSEEGLQATTADLLDVRNRIATKISELAKTHHGGSLREMERKTKISNAFLGDVVKLVKAPSLKTLYQLSIYYEVPVQVFLSEGKFRKRNTSPKTLEDVVPCLRKQIEKILKSHPQHQLHQLLPNLDGDHLPKLETLWMTAQKLNLSLGDLLP